MDNLDFLARSNQTSRSYARFMNALMMRPVSYVKNGTISSKGMLAGSREKVWKKYISLCLNGLKLDQIVIFISHVGLTKKEMEWIRAEIAKKQNFNAIYFQQTSPAVAISLGPGSFGISVVEKA